VRSFLGNGTDKAHELGTPAFDLTPEFRVNRAQEVDANKIAEWRFEVGERAISNTEPQHSVRWNYGEPIQVTLRWAMNAPVVPTDDGSNPALQVRDRTAIFEYKNVWALFKLLAKHDEAATFSRGEARTPLLKFVVPTQAADLSDTDHKPNTVTIAYIRLHLTGPEQSLKLVTPIFPERAPPARPMTATWSLNP
jgi:type VI secretion system protein ImpL